MDDALSQAPLLDEDELLAQSAMDRHFKKNYLGEEMESSFESMGHSMTF